MANNLLFSYKLLNDDATKTTNTDGIFVSSWGSAAEQGRKYWLEIYAQTNAWDTSSDVLQSIDFTLTFDNKIFKGISASDLKIESSLPLYRSANLSDTTEVPAGTTTPNITAASTLQNTIRFAAGSASEITGNATTATGSGIDLSATTPSRIARILLDVNDDYFRTKTLTGADDTTKTITKRDEIGATPASLFLSDILDVSVNQDETFFGDLKSLRGKGGTAREASNAPGADGAATSEPNDGASIKIQRGTQLVLERGATFDTYTPLGTDLHFGTGLTATGVSTRTNLIRAGSTLKTQFNIANIGTSSLQNLNLVNQLLNPNESTDVTSDYYASISPSATATLKAWKNTRNTDGTLTAGTAKTLSAKDNSLSTTLADNSLALVRDASGAIKSNLLGDGTNDKNKSGDELTMELTVSVQTNKAGEVLELKNVGGFIMEADGFTKTFTGLDTKNLITYKGDLNYDGKVSFADLTYLNAGAAKQKQDGSKASDYADVDANFDGKIDIADLAVLDADWGKSLHTASGVFTGQTGSTGFTNWVKEMTEFPGTGAATPWKWTNTAFDIEFNNNKPGATGGTVISMIDADNSANITAGTAITNI